MHLWGEDVQGRKRKENEYKEKFGNTEIGAPAKPLRMNSEKFIDYLYSHFRYHFDNKPRDYQEIAHKDFIAYTKKRKPRGKAGTNVEFGAKISLSLTREAYSLFCFL